MTSTIESTIFNICIELFIVAVLPRFFLEDVSGQPRSYLSEMRCISAIMVSASVMCKCDLLLVKDCKSRLSYLSVRLNCSKFSRTRPSSKVFLGLLGAAVIRKIHWNSI